VANEPEMVKALPGHRTMDRWAEDRLVDLAAGSAPDVEKRGYKQELLAFADELAGPDPTPIEATLAKTAALCWFAMRVAEAQHAAYLKAPEVTPAGAEFRQRRLGHAHRRYLSTLRTLAQVRKLARPMIQVNVARQQVNVAGAAPRALGVAPDQPAADGRACLLAP
jgi:hypothetical protein